MAESAPGTGQPWRPARFFRAVPGGVPIEAWGYEHRGLALRHAGWATPRTETRWTLIHLGSGGTVVQLVGSVAVAMPVAGEIAACSDWTLFELPGGWRQTDPDLPAKVAAICAAHPEARADATAMAAEISTDDARAVIDARENAHAG